LTDASDTSTPSVLVTGGGTGIGAAIARRLASEGFSVCVSGRREAPLREVADEIGGLAVGADAADPAQARRAVEAAAERFGRLDALVCNAGTGASGTVTEQTLERFNRVIATNLTGVFLSCQAALPYLLKTRGSVVTIGSLAGLRAGPASAAYCASKAALIMLTQCIAVDYGSRGIRANCVCPGWIGTPMADGEMDDLAQRRGTDRDGAWALAVAEVPAGRAGRPEEVADAVRWLVAPGAGYVNGAVITIDGGAAVVDAGSLAFKA